MFEVCDGERFWVGWESESTVKLSRRKSFAKLGESPVERLLRNVPLSVEVELVEERLQSAVRQEEADVDSCCEELGVAQPFRFFAVQLLDYLRHFCWAQALL